MATSPNVQLWLYSNQIDIDIPALSIPLTECGRYAIKPLKWLRYIGYSIYGAKGYLSTSKGGEDIGDYEADVEPRAYYFTSESKLDSSYFMILANIDNVFRRTSLR